MYSNITKSKISYNPYIKVFITYTVYYLLIKTCNNITYMVLYKK